MNNVMRYKGYFAKIEYSEEDDCFHGIVEGIVDLISFEGTTVQELRKDFEGAIDDYIDLCKRNNKEPFKQYNGNFNIRIKPELHWRATVLSKLENVSLNKFVEMAIQDRVRVKSVL